MVHDKVRPMGRGIGISSSYDSSWEEASFINLSGDGIFKRKVVVAPDGEVYPCIFTREISMGNVLEYPLHEIIYEKNRTN